MNCTQGRGAVSNDEIRGPKVAAAVDAVVPPCGEVTALEDGLVTFRQNDRNVTVVVRVEAIDAASVGVDYSRSAVLLWFTTCRGAGADGRRSYRHELRLAGEIEPAACRHDTSKSNLVGQVFSSLPLPHYPSNCSPSLAPTPACPSFPSVLLSRLGGKQVGESFLHSC